VKVTRFDRGKDLIIVPAWVSGPRETKKLSLVLDTGAAETLIKPDVLEEIGYSARDGERLATLRSPLGREHGYTLCVERLSCLGFFQQRCLLHVFELAVGDDIDGLVGLSFLDKLNYEVRPREGRIHVDRADGQPWRREPFGWLRPRMRGQLSSLLPADRTRRSPGS
jgi:predicted aspartyl protease